MLRDRLVRRARSLLERVEETYRALREKPAAAPPPRSEPEVRAEPAPAPKRVNWELRSQGEIVDHILEHYHAGLRRDLPALIAASRSVVRENAAHPDVPAGLTDLLETLSNELEGHMQKEERVLFPALRTNERGGSISMPIRMMERDHEAHDAMLDELRTLTRNFSAPADAPAAWTTLYAELAALESALHEHIYLENNVLFARAVGGSDY